MFANKNNNGLKEGWTLIQIISALKILNSVEIFGFKYIILIKNELNISNSDKLLKYDKRIDNEKEIKALFDKFEKSRNQKDHFRKYCQIF